ncbi:accessory factor UbiK family protein [Stakelama marina]|uniref:Accessory factor UbiK family protein n=1 Tax=Stakelama marina TaxID=2826939 RepID=A0A8T4IH56_9SPHN|nr:accessory factor UbiK family protein [Stakelama marina]MBR0553831.1 accessory factor UbiK family protein [Stakelama marina]
MQTENRFFDDFVKFMNGAAGTVAGMAREGESAARDRAREWIGGLDFVSREEFEAVKAMASAARDENDELKKRIEALEAAAKDTAKPAAARKPKAAPKS